MWQVGGPESRLWQGSFSSWASFVACPKASAAASDEGRMSSGQTRRLDPGRAFHAPCLGPALKEPLLYSSLHQARNYFSKNKFLYKMYGKLIKTNGVEK